MRFILPIVALAFLAACETTTTATAPTAPGPAPAVAAVQPSPIARMLSAAGRDNAATQAEVVRLMGAPDIERREGAGVALTYRLETCAVLLLFSADQRNAMRLAEAHLNARRPGEAAPSLDTCAAEASNRRS